MEKDFFGAISSCTLRAEILPFTMKNTGPSEGRENEGGMSHGK
jgi:hypothetical protein